MDLNHVTLTGILERDSITRFADHGTQQVSFTLRLTEAGPAGQAFTLFVPCEAYRPPRSKRRKIYGWIVSRDLEIPHILVKATTYSQ